MNDRIYRFADFELRTAEGELRTGDTSIKLQEKPLLLLTVLLDHPQSLVTREQLRERMWASDTFVDYEQGINVAIKKIRDALGDSAENPRFIQTVAKKGYRFLLPVDVADVEDASATSAPQPVSNALPERQSFDRRHWIFASLAAAGLLVLGLWIFEMQAKPHASAQIHSLAVLPLQNLSPDPGQGYFADGVTEELITDLAQSLPLRVISRTSVMRYKQTSEPMTQIARELGVDAVIEGAVARSGDRVAVTVQLIDANQDRHLWAQKYDRKIEDLLALEAELSQEIASQVGDTLISQHRLQGAKYRPADPQVYDLCLLGRYHWNKRTAVDLNKSIEYFEQATQRDPNYAPAYAGLADAYAILPSYDSVSLKDSFSRAAAAARHAIELDDTLAEAHTTLGFIDLQNFLSDSAQAEHEFRRAFQLNPNYATAHHWYSFYLLFSGRRDESLTEMEVARQLDPLSAIINADQGHLLYAAGRYEEAEIRLRQAIELAPDLGQPHETLALIDLAKEQSSDASGEARTGLKLDAENPRTLAETGYVLAATGHADDAKKLLVRLDEQIQRGSASSVFAAFIHIGLGQRGRALDILEEAADSNKGAGLLGLEQWPTIFDQLNGEPRYQKLMAETRINAGSVASR